MQMKDDIKGLLKDALDKSDEYKIAGYLIQRFKVMPFDEKDDNVSMLLKYIDEYPSDAVVNERTEFLNSFDPKGESGLTVCSVCGDFVHDCEYDGTYCRKCFERRFNRPRS